MLSTENETRKQVIWVIDTAQLSDDCGCIREQGAGPVFPAAYLRAEPRDCMWLGWGLQGEKHVVYQQNRHAMIYKDNAYFESMEEQKERKRQSYQRWARLYLGELRAL